MGFKISNFFRTSVTKAAVFCALAACGQKNVVDQRGRQISSSAGDAVDNSAATNGSQTGSDANTPRPKSRVLPLVDKTFALSGASRQAISSIDVKINDFVVLQDGGIVAVGSKASAPSIPYSFPPALNTNPHEFIVMRLTKDGALDSSFGERVTGGSQQSTERRGYSSYSITGSTDSRGYRIALESDGNFLVAGTYGAGTGFALLRISGDGALQSTFGTNGIVTSPCPATGASVAGLVRTSSKIMLAGTCLKSPGTGLPEIPHVRLVVLSPGNGAVDALASTFHLVGGKPSAAFDALLVNDKVNDKIYVAGSVEMPDPTIASNPGVHHQMVLRFKDDATLDTSFGTNGAAINSDGSSNGAVLALVASSDGANVVAIGMSKRTTGNVTRETATAWSIPYNYRDNYRGANDSVCFAAMGGTANFVPFSAALDVNGKILVAGSLRRAGAGFAMAAFQLGPNSTVSGACRPVIASAGDQSDAQSSIAFAEYPRTAQHEFIRKIIMIPGSDGRAMMAGGVSYNNSGDRGAFFTRLKLDENL